jgi:ATP/maltotriose-dependent transcriptional regulator MalT
MAQERQRGVAFAKTTRPVIGSAVRRERLFARMDGTPGRTVVWISGPPGAGKSTLVASYIEARNCACIWYQVDPDDADVATFFHYLGHAARRLDAGRTRELPAFAPQYSGDVAAFARNFFRQLFMHVKSPVVLVLDNLHEVSANSPLHAALEAGLAQVPGHCCVVIISRTEPPAALARMRLSGGARRAPCLLGFPDSHRRPRSPARGAGAARVRCNPGPEHDRRRSPRRARRPGTARDAAVSRPDPVPSVLRRAAG